MADIGSRGRTVIFISHSMPMILRLCTRVILIDAGRIVADGAPHEVSRRYMQSEAGGTAERIWHDQKAAPGDHVARLQAVRVRNVRGDVVGTFDIQEPVYLEIQYWSLQSTLFPTAAFHLINEDGITLFASIDFNDRTWASTPRSAGLVTATCRIPGNFLAEGQFFVLAAVTSYNPDAIHALEHDAVAFQVVDRSQGDGVRGPFSGAWPGVLRPHLEWKVVKESA
jgi:lipopolysaccharide transport system ATP-binding protein